MGTNVTLVAAGQQSASNMTFRPCGGAMVTRLSQWVDMDALIIHYYLQRMTAPIQILVSFQGSPGVGDFPLSCLLAGLL